MEIILKVKSNNASADGVSRNNISITVSDGVHWISNARVHISLNGSAVFTSNGSNKIDLKTDVIGRINNVALVDDQPETVTLVAQLADYDHKTASEDLTFISTDKYELEFLYDSEDAANQIINGVKLSSSTGSNILGLKILFSAEFPYASISPKSAYTDNTGCIRGVHVDIASLTYGTHAEWTGVRASLAKDPGVYCSQSFLVAGNIG
ncbi:hypothetical protein [Brucella oryzae]|uniref:hypothetical protein n=1 Tax=Brucella oryzae TaxID=335286 RepID=UPI0011B02D67|nr:hypothetical protein [Brucella oryzae]